MLPAVATGKRRANELADSHSSKKLALPNKPIIGLS